MESIISSTIFTIAFVVIALLFLMRMFRVLREYERGVIFLLGRFYRVKGPGLIIVFPVIQQMASSMRRPGVDLVSVPELEVFPAWQYRPNSRRRLTVR